MPGHWEGDLIKGAYNRSSVGTLVERKTRYVVLSKMRDGTAEAALEGFHRQMRHLPAILRQSLAGLKIQAQQPSRRPGAPRPSPPRAS